MHCLKDPGFGSAALARLTTPSRGADWRVVLEEIGSVYLMRPLDEPLPEGPQPVSLNAIPLK
jgi:hypothetical protein